MQNKQSVHCWFKKLQQCNTDDRNRYCH